METFLEKVKEYVSLRTKWEITTDFLAGMTILILVFLPVACLAIFAYYFNLMYPNGL